MGCLLQGLGILALIIAAICGCSLMESPGDRPRQYEGFFVQTTTPAYERYMEVRENKKSIACWSLGLGLAFLAVGAIVSIAESQEKKAGGSGS